MNGDNLFKEEKFKDAAFQYKLYEDSKEYDPYNTQHKLRYGKSLKFINKFDQKRLNLSPLT